MAYFYYYQQQQQTLSDPLSPVTTSSELTPLLVIPPTQQPQLALPLLTPIMPPVTSAPDKTTAVSTEHNQTQLHTPNTFIRLCEDIGLFHDLQNIVVMSSCQPADTATSTVPVSTAATIVTTSTSTGQPTTSTGQPTTSTGQPTTSNLCSSSTTAIVTTMMMANPFDETFKQAVLQQQKSDINLPENHFSTSSNDGDLNTPFITTTTIVDTSNDNSTLSMTTPIDMMTKTVIDTPLSIESMMTNMTTMPEPQHQNMFITTSSTEAGTGNVLVMMVEQQQHQHIIEQHHPQQRFIVPATTATTNAIGTTIMTMTDPMCYNDEDASDNGNIEEMAIEGLTEITTIKQALKQNLLVKQLIQGQQSSPVVSEQLQQQRNGNDGFITTEPIQDNTMYNSSDQDDDDSKKQQLKKKHKQELLERNRTAAKRCRMKRKQKWEMLSEENRKLKVENNKLRDTITNLISNCNKLSE
ncbi:Basic-leucine zipper domain [Cinara cedri]|uniref:Basic-leucine zipper domain n=1 Tax=Cinara cedri TaxID=506608 RepID=A0A5E4M6H9_9HEMI|nr:Basic-leucine zipper domain [Cinara cedri]